MIQLSDTKAAPGLGVLLGQKPKAGGDASAFALAFGSLAADGQTGFSIPLPRQTIAAGGSPLPDTESDAETGDAIDAEIGVMMTAAPMVPDASATTPNGFASAPTSTSTEAPEPLATTPAAFELAPERSTPTDRTVKHERNTLDARIAGKTAPVAAQAPTQPSSPPMASVEPTPVPDDNATDVSAATPADPAATLKHSAAAVVAAPLAAAREPVTPPIANAPHKVPVATEAIPISDRVAVGPQAIAPNTSAPARPERAGVAVPSAILSPGTKTVSPEAKPAIAAPSAILSPNTEDASPAPRVAVPVPSATSAPAAQPVKAVMPNPVLSEAASPAAARAIPGDRPALAARLQATPANAAATRREGAGPKTPLDSTVGAAIQAPLTKVEAPVPAKFIPVERPVDGPSDRPASRRIAITPAPTMAAPVLTKPMTVADLIPIEPRPRLSTTPTALVTDPASIGLSAPVEAASRIAEPAPLDTQAGEWIEGMIEQIDVMRDAHAEGASETTTTRIRLSPDALGGVEIVLSGEGEAIDVRINADTAAARTLLAEAAPRLADMAEARGLKLAQGDAGQPGQHQAQRQQNQNQPTANRGRTPDSATTGGNPDERIA